MMDDCFFAPLRSDTHTHERHAFSIDDGKFESFQPKKRKDTRLLR